MHHFVQRHENVALDVAATPRAARLPELICAARSILAETKSETAPAAKELFEEIAETSTAEMEFLVTGSARWPRATSTVSLPTGRRFKARAFFRTGA